MNYLPLVIIVIVLFVAMTLTRRNRQRAAAVQQEQAEQIRFGTEVMTTSGLYGTVVGMNDDDTVQLSIAPGIQVSSDAAAARSASPTPCSTTSRAPGRFATSPS